MSFLYPRTIAVHRPVSANAGGFGATTYNANLPAAETVIATGLKASIQMDRQGKANTADLPADTYAQSTYKVFIPASAAPLGLIKVRDIIVDDLGTRYSCYSPYWDSFGYRLGVTVLET